MTANETNILDFLEGAKKVFIIPPFQRNYEWNTIQCEELFEDIKLIASDEGKKHYLGNIVYYTGKKSPSTGTEYILVDGQQRITTILILLCALRDSDTEGKLQVDIYSDFLENKIKNNSFETKLKQTAYDQDDFSALVMKGGETDKDSKVYQNYKFFMQLIENSDISIDTLLNTFYRIEIADIDLDVKDDLETVQRIFEKINSTGKPLTTGDMIRNFLLLTNDLTKQEKLYQKYWFEIEKKIISENVSDFTQDYLRMKTYKDIKEEDTYKEFKKEFSKSNYEKQDILENMFKYSKYYCWLLDPTKIISNGNKRSNDIKKLIEKIKSIKAKDYMSLLMLLFEKMYNEKDIIELEKILKLLRDFLLRYRIVKPSGGGGGLATVVNQLLKKISTKEIECNYENVLNELSNSKNPSGRFPRNDEFKQALQESVDVNYAKLVLLIIEENEKNKDIPINISQITIEHIMPKTLKPDWKKDLGADAMSIHEKFLKSIGNLVPLSQKWNSSLSNKEFIVKKRKYFEQQFSITREIYNFEKWGQEELVKRNINISERACKYIIGPLKRSKDYSLDNEEIITFKNKIEDVKNKKIQAILYSDKEYNIENWKDLSHKISEILYENGNNKFESIYASKKLLIVDVSGKEKLKNAKQIKNSKFYCETDIKLSKDSFKYAKIIAEYFNQEDKFKIIVENEDDK
ncbi:DUF262 domain-containing protein [Leptotrichia wadei]|uniref:DUF262 domain-containing protein n=1 Tax=Leptotrichia wadei TaxID=157687 RepID=A0A510KEG8_9FUSO|nr:DUF262 domain-containing protein [Leptotrichia wadei]BBM50078.1 hypothetical protein JMUB3934_1374 [Leptotrichia wadei]